jgi:predicted ABC-type ATPase
MDVQQPVLWLIAGPNGAGKTTYYRNVASRHFRAPFINADLIARERYGRHPKSDREMLAAAEEAERCRNGAIRSGRSFVAETVLSHPSKLELIERARQAGYYVRLTFVGVSDPALCVLRVSARLEGGGHGVPLEKITERYTRSIGIARQAVGLAHWAMVLDNTSAEHPHRQLLLYELGLLARTWPPLPAWVRGFPGV